jgi:hypothetical protein
MLRVLLAIVCSLRRVEVVEVLGDLVEGELAQLVRWDVRAEGEERLESR